MCWYYGIQLYKELGYPIGLVSTTWGGTPVEAWSSPDALAACGINETAKIVDAGRLVFEQTILETLQQLKLQLFYKLSFADLIVTTYWRKPVDDKFWQSACNKSVDNSCQLSPG